MQYKAVDVADYISQLPNDRKAAVQYLHASIMAHLPTGFEETIQYGMISYVVPKSIYPAGYHCDAKQPLPFAALASQKQSINFYHMGIYADPAIFDWFVTEFPKHSKRKLDMGKSCIRFKYVDEIPVTLLTELMQKLSCAQWITLYEEKFRAS